MFIYKYGELSQLCLFIVNKMNLTINYKISKGKFNHKVEIIAVKGGVAVYLALDELLYKSEELRKILLNIRRQLPEDYPFDRLLILICMGKGGFLTLETLPNRAVMHMICESSELFEQILPYLDQQFLYQCMDNGTKAEIMQCINTVRQQNITKAVREEYYFKALTIFYQTIYDTIAPDEKLWEELSYRLMCHWHNLNRDFIASFKQVD